MARRMTLMLLLLAVISTVRSQTCAGNGFVGGCSTIHELIGQPVGLTELIGSASTTQVCEGDVLAIEHDCTNRIPLSVTVKLDRTDIDTDNPGRCDACDFRPSSYLTIEEQAVDTDYDGANERLPCYEQFSDGVMYKDPFWLATSPGQLCFASEPTTGTSRGHMIADSYITSGNSEKDATYHFTNCVPQYQKFNNEAWNIAEQDLIGWLDVQCGSSIADPIVKANAYAHVMVGVIPSTSVTTVFSETNVSPRWFGEWGFGDGVFDATIDYNGNTPAYPAAYRVNMPAAMWTAVCCIGLDANSNVAYVKHMAFGRHSRPIGNDDPVIQAPADQLFAQMLPEFDTSGVNLFPSEPLCYDPANYVALG